MTGPFFDTSVLIRGLVLLGEPDAAALRIFDAIGEGKLGEPQTAWHCCLEFVAVTTRLPEEFRLPLDEAILLVRREILARFAVRQLPPSEFEALLTAALGDQVGGGRIYDLHIAEVARASGSRIVVTNNRRHFGGLLRLGISVLSTDDYAVQEGF